MTSLSSRIPGDAHLRQLVLEELEWDKRVDVRDIVVAVLDGTVTLCGAVDSYSKRLAAEEAAQNILGVKGVLNQIDVHPPNIIPDSDAELARAALTALTRDAAIPSETLDVVVSQGWVILGGTVDVPFQRQEAERVVRHLARVRGVINRIAVRVAIPTSKDVRGRIERALIRNAGTDAERIRIQVSGDKVVLQGTVRSNAERRAAEGAAQTAPGISDVENYLVVTPPI